MRETYLTRYVLFLLLAILLTAGGTSFAQKKSGRKGNIPSPLDPVRPNAKHGPKIEQFLDKAETYWHVYSANLPENLYAFLAEYPNTLLDAKLLPGKGWFIQGQYQGRYDDFPTEIAAKEKDGFDLSSLTVAPDGGWVIFSGKTQQSETYVSSVGAKMQVPYNSGPWPLETRSASWKNISNQLADEINRVTNDWTYIDFLRFTPEGEWVLVYHRQDRCGFGFSTSDNINPEFYKALYDLWVSGQPVNDIGFYGDNGYVIIVNGVGYAAKNLPAKAMEGLEVLRKANSSYRTTRVVFSYDKRWLIFGRDKNLRTYMTTCEDKFDPTLRLGSPKNSFPESSDPSLPTLKRREPDQLEGRPGRPVPTDIADPAFAKLIQDDLRSKGMKGAEVEAMRRASGRYFISVGNVVRQESELKELTKQIEKYIFDIALKKDIVWEVCIKYHIDFDKSKPETCGGKKPCKVHLNGECFD